MQKKFAFEIVEQLVPLYYSYRLKVSGTGEEVVKLQSCWSHVRDRD